MKFWKELHPSNKIDVLEELNPIHIEYLEKILKDEETYTEEGILPSSYILAGGQEAVLFTASEKSLTDILVCLHAKICKLLQNFS